MVEESKTELDLLFDYPSLLSLIEKFIFPHSDPIFRLPFSTLVIRLSELPASMIPSPDWKENSMMFITTFGKNGSRKHSISKIYLTSQAPTLFGLILSSSLLISHNKFKSLLNEFFKTSIFYSHILMESSF